MISQSESDSLHGNEPAPRRPLVSILIVNYNGEHLLRGCLNSLSLVKEPSFEVVVVDNASQDNSLEILRGYTHIKIVESKMNRGFAGGNNLGLPHCVGDYILLLNSDTIVRPDFLRPLCEYLDQHREVGIVQAKMFLPNREGRLDNCGSFLTRFGFMYHRGFLKHDAAIYNTAGPIFSAKGACMMFRREMVEAAGGYLFDEDFFCYYEETDFCHRAWLAGYESHFVPGSIIDHLMGATSEKSQHRDFVMSHFLENQMFSLLANLEAGSAFRIMPFYFALFFASLGAAVVTGKSSLARAHLKALAANCRHLSKLRRQRAAIRRIRKISDRELFAKIMRNPGWDYFLKTFRGRIQDYQDN